MKINNWLYNMWWASRLKNLKDLPFKMKNETDAIVSNTVLEIINETDDYWIKITKFPYKLDIKTVQNICAQVNRDDFGKQKMLPNPVYSANQRIKMRLRHYFYTCALIFIPISEAGMYFITASLFLPGVQWWLQLPVALFLTVVTILGFENGFSDYDEYSDALERHSKKEISDFELAKAKRKRTFGLVLIIATFTIVILAGIGRGLFLENGDTSELGATQGARVHFAGILVSISILLIAVVSSYMLSRYKQKCKKNAVEYGVFKEWDNANKKRNALVEGLYESVKKLKLEVERGTEKGWQLVIDLKRIFQMLLEHDEKFLALYNEYFAAKGQKGFIHDDDIYRKYQEIQCVYPELFRYGIFNHPSIKEKLELATQIEKIPKEYMGAYLESLPKQEVEKLTDVNPEHNGKANNSVYQKIKTI